MFHRHQRLRSKLPRWRRCMFVQSHRLSVNVMTRHALSRGIAVRSFHVEPDIVGSRSDVRARYIFIHEGFHSWTYSFAINVWNRYKRPWTVSSHWTGETMRLEFINFATVGHTNFTRNKIPPHSLFFWHETLSISSFTASQILFPSTASACWQKCTNSEFDMRLRMEFERRERVLQLKWTILISLLCNLHKER